MEDKKYNSYENDYIVTLDKLTVDYKMKAFSLRANDEISLKIKRNSITAFVGESGSGKTTLAVSLFNCLVEPGEITSGKVLFHSKDETTIDVTTLNEDELRKFRWEKVAMVFQGAQSSLNPVMTIYKQFKETYLQHRPKTKEDIIKKRCHEVLDIVNLDGERILKMYPHELSGGMKQRVMIAFAFLLEPELIILDEPTTALDVITQEYIFSILKEINEKMAITLVLLTHDIAIVARYADYLAVMYAGNVVEYGETTEVFKKRYHPYTAGLIKATPSLILPLDEMAPIDGNPIDLLNKCAGCLFAPRCPKRFSPCDIAPPPHIEVEPNHFVQCYLYDKAVKK